VRTFVTAILVRVQALLIRLGALVPRVRVAVSRVGRIPEIAATLRGARRLWRFLHRRGAVGWHTGRRAWRRSLQVRMVTITLVVSAALVGAFGYLVAQRITVAMLNNKITRAQEQADKGASTTAQQLQGFSQPNDPNLSLTLTDVLRGLASTDQQGGGVVVAIRPSGQASLISPQTFPLGLPVQSAISSGLQREVAAGNQAHQIVTEDIGSGRQPYLVYGTPVPTRLGQLELYHFFPVVDEITLANQVRNTVIATGAALVLLLAVIAALVTRLVVNPVRVAARTAQRLSAGLLDQRMVVRGEDDLALLAASFNQMAENLQRQIVRLEDMSRLQRRFTSDVSHELRTPLTTVRMAADLMFAQRDEFEPVMARSAELLQAELDRFEALLTDLLEISRFDAGFAVLDAEPTDLVPVIQRVTNQLASLAGRCGVELRVRVPDAPVIAEVDPRRVERVLRNLVGNAVEHGECRPVEVTLGADENAIAVTVRDHGIGLRPGEERLVFNRFWRADPSRARQTGGTGLGLSISLEDARLHGGWLEAWGEPGAGAQFRLTLPVRAGDRLLSSPLRLAPLDAYLDMPRPGSPPQRLAIEAHPAVLQPALLEPAVSPADLEQKPDQDPRSAAAPAEAREQPGVDATPTNQDLDGVRA
jgi:two-component system sensor histidine kinase MtrB